MIPDIAITRNAGQQGAFGATTPQRDVLLKSGHKTSLVIDSQGVCPTYRCAQWGSHPDPAAHSDWAAPPVHSHPYPCCLLLRIILSIMGDKPGAAKLWLSLPLALNWLHWDRGRKNQTYTIRQCGKRQAWHRYGKTWQLLLGVRDARKPHKSSSHQERGCASSISSGQETGLIAKPKITESLSAYLSLDVSRLNKYGHTSLQVKWKDAECPGLQEWGGFAPLKCICLNFTSSLISLIWDHHCSAIFSFGQMHIDHFQKWFLSLRTDTASFHGTCSSQRSHTAL